MVLEHLIAYEPLDSLNPYGANAKDHDIGLIVTSIRRFGFITPIIVDEQANLIVAGHGRLDALKQMRDDGEAPPAGIRTDGGAWLAPVVRGIAFAADGERRAFTVAENRSVEAGGWLEDLLLLELEALAEAAVPFDGIGYDADDLDAMIRAATWEDDPTPPEDEHPITVRAFGLKVTLPDEAAEDALYFELRHRSLNVERLSGKKGE